ncbi:MAG: hypothetical protein ACUVTX_12680 [Bacteroidales bacterium]
MSGEMRSNWCKDKQWSDSFLPEIEKIVRFVAGKIIDIRPSTDGEDKDFATDYVIEISSGRIACRVRKAEYRKFDDVTIRAWRSSMMKTELDKLREGQVRWYLYVWASESEKEITDWIFWDVKKAQESGLFENRTVLKNVDETTGFISVPIDELEFFHCVVARKEDFE